MRQRFLSGGWAALRKRWRAVGTDRRLNTEQEKEIQKPIVDHAPDQLKMTFAIWSRQAVQQQLIIALNNQGELEWMALTDAMNSYTFLKCLAQIIKFRKRKIILVVDNIMVHHSPIVQAWVEANKERIKLVFLLAYSPQINPDEHWNNALQQSLASKQPAMERVRLDAMVEVFMLMRSFMKDHVIAIFRHS